MATATTATIQSLANHKLTSDGATAIIAIVYTLEDGSTTSAPTFEYQLPLPVQTLPDDSQIPACDAFAVPGEPDQDELYDNCMVLSRYYAAQFGLPYAESDIDLTVNYPG